MTNKYKSDPKTTIGTGACLDHQFMLNYSSEVHQNFVHEGVIVARRIEEETPNTFQNEDSQSVTADMAPIKKKRKLVDFLTL